MSISRKAFYSFRRILTEFSSKQTADRAAKTVVYCTSRNAKHSSGGKRFSKKMYLNSSRSNDSVFILCFLERNLLNNFSSIICVFYCLEIEMLMISV